MLNEWIEWNGGDCPVPKETVVKTQMRNGSEEQYRADYLRWEHMNFGGDIIKYQVLTTTLPTTLPAARDRINKIKETIAKLEKEQAELLDFIRSEWFVLVDEKDTSSNKTVSFNDMSDPKTGKQGMY